MSTPNSFDDELDKLMPCDCSFEFGFGHKPGSPCEGCYNGRMKKHFKSLYLTHRNAEYKKLLEKKRTLVAVDLGSFDYIPVAAIKDLMKKGLIEF